MWSRYNTRMGVAERAQWHGEVIDWWAVTEQLMFTWYTGFEIIKH